MALSITQPVVAAEDVLQAMRKYHEAMVEARTYTLETLLEPDFTLTHITGYVQPRNDWLLVVRSGRFDYHQIDIDESSLVLSDNTSSAELRGRGIFNATINGTKSPWRLQFTLQFVPRNGSWKLASAIYTSY
jgi:hypothetical protein